MAEFCYSLGEKKTFVNVLIQNKKRGMGYGQNPFTCKAL